MLKQNCASFLMLCLVFLATPLLATAQTGVATGRYKFIMDDEAIKYLEFDAKSDERGSATGYMLFTDEAKIFFQDVDGTGDVSRESGPFSMKADLDAMTIEKNKAIMSGVVRDSNFSSYVGYWVQLVIEDNDGFDVADRFVWTFCQPEPGGWIPSDAERKDDQGAFLSWWATDAERRDDVGIPSPSYIPGGLKACKSYSLQSYEFAPILKGDGVITIRQ